MTIFVAIVVFSTRAEDARVGQNRSHFSSDLCSSKVALFTFTVSEV